MYSQIRVLSVQKKVFLERSSVVTGHTDAAVAIALSLAVSFSVEQWGFGAGWVVRERQVTNREILGRRSPQNVAPDSVL